MAISSLTQISLPTLTQTVDQTFLVEPLQGADKLESYLEIFPDSVYHKGASSHLVKLLYTLLGPAGVALVQQEYLKARLIIEEHGINNSDLESFYGDPFSFGRILSELPANDPSGMLTADEWETILSQDASYRNRAIDFLHGVRLGNTLAGMELVARSGIGRAVLVVEQYKYLFDQHSDDPFGLVNYGKTVSTEEMVVLPNNEISNTQVQVVTLNWSEVGPTGLATVVTGSGGSWGSTGTYYYVVTAVTVAGESFPSAEVSAVIGATGDTATLSWTPVPGALSYNVYRATSPGGETGSTSLAAQVYNAISYADSGMSTGPGGVTQNTFAFYFNGWYAPYETYTNPTTGPQGIYPPATPPVPPGPGASQWFTVDPAAVVAATAIVNINTASPGTSTFGGTTVSSGQYVRLAFQTSADESGVWIFHGPSSPMIVAPAIYADSFTVAEYMNALPSVGGGNVSVTGGASVASGKTVLTPWTFTFTNQLANNATINTIDVISSYFSSVAFEVTTGTGIVNADQEIVDIAPADLHSLQVALDRIKSVTTIPTVHPFTSIRQNQPWANIYATTQQNQVVRYVSGLSNVDWPPIDSYHWIVAGVENQAPRLANDPQHDYQGFHNPVITTASTEQVGQFGQMETALFPFLRQQTDPTEVFAAKQAIAPNASGTADLYIRQVALPDSGMPIAMIDGIYPFDYGVQMVNPNTTFWSSRENTTGDETLMIDFGSPQALNYIDFEIAKKPFGITIQYDTMDQGPPYLDWHNVTPNPTLTYDDSIGFTTDQQTLWYTAEFNFTDGVNDVIYARYLLITFTRGLAPPQFGGFGWTCNVQNLRAGRVVG